MDVIQTPSDQQATYNSNSSVVNPPVFTDTAKRTEHSSPSLTMTDGSLGPRALKSCPLLLGGSWRKDSPGWEKAEITFTATSGLRVLVCPVSHPYPRVCCSVSLVQIKSDNYYYVLSGKLGHDSPS